MKEEAGGDERGGCFRFLLGVGYGSKGGLSRWLRL